MKKQKEPKGEYKFNEKEYVEELLRVIDSTYTGHYSRDHFQATEFIIDGGHGTGFCIGNIMKYAQRYGKKGSRDDARKDLLKVLLPEKNEKWRKNKPGKPKHTFNDAVPFNQRKDKAKFKSKKKRR